MNDLIVFTAINMATALAAICFTWLLYVQLSDKIVDNLKKFGQLNDMIERLDNDLSKEIDDLRKL